MNTNTAQIAVLLAAISYSSTPQKEIATLLPGWKIVWNGIQTEDGNYAFIASDANETQYALAIRGSLPPFHIFTDWYAFANWVLEDLDVITRVRWPYATTGNAFISRGALTAFNNIKGMQDQLSSGKSILAYLSDYAVAYNKQVLITGHSLGGNMANVYASYFLSAINRSADHSNNTSLYTFAAPAAGNSDFARDLDAKIPDAHHYENSNDIVPKFPVSLSIIEMALLFAPCPSAGEITVTCQGYKASLREFLLLLSGIFYLPAYKQPTNNYKLFFNRLNEQYTSNSLTDWFYQAGSQHAMSVYASYFGVTVPPQLDQLSQAM